MTPTLHRALGGARVGLMATTEHPQISSPEYLRLSPDEQAEILRAHNRRNREAFNRTLIAAGQRPLADEPRELDSYTFPELSDEEYEAIYHPARFAGANEAAPSIDAPEGGGGPQRSGGGSAQGPTEKQLAYLATLAAERGIACPEPRSKRTASEEIDRLLAMPKAEAPAAEQAEAPAEKPARTNRYAGRCESCGQNVAAEAGELSKGPGGWEVRHFPACPEPSSEAPAAAPAEGLDLSALPEGRYGIPGGDTRLKVRIDRPSEGRWEGWIFVKDAAAYGEGQRYGSQKPGAAYRGKIEEALRAILADPKAALLRYAELTDNCGICGRKLEDEESVKRGIGPVHWDRTSVINCVS